MNSSVTNNRRGWMRFPGDQREVTFEFANGARIAGLVVDESFGGLGILCTEPVAAEAGDAVNVFVDGTNLPATVRSVIRQSNGACRVGVQWPKTERKSRSAKRTPAATPPAPDRKQFLSEIPSGVFKLSALFERENWGLLDESLEKLSAQAERIGVEGLKPPIVKMREGIQRRQDSVMLAEAFELLVESCLELAEAA